MRTVLYLMPASPDKTHFHPSIHHEDHGEAPEKGILFVENRPRSSIRDDMFHTGRKC